MQKGEIFTGGIPH